MKEQNVIGNFSYLVWQEMNSSVQMGVEYGTFKNNGNVLILFESNFASVQKLISHIIEDSDVNSADIYEKNALVIKSDGRKSDETLYIKNGKECFNVCHKFYVQSVIVIKPHIHSLDSLYLETFLRDLEKETENYVFAYEADELSKIVNAERHIESLQLYWHLMSWFAKSDLKQKYIKKYRN